MGWEEGRTYLVALRDGKVKSVVLMLVSGKRIGPSATALRENSKRASTEINSKNNFIVPFDGMEYLRGEELKWIFSGSIQAQIKKGGDTRDSLRSGIYHGRRFARVSRFDQAIHTSHHFFNRNTRPPLVLAL